MLQRHLRRLAEPHVSLPVIAPVMTGVIWALTLDLVRVEPELADIASTGFLDCLRGPAQVADIFLGKTSRFPDGTQAVPIDQPEDSPLRDRFYSQFTGKSPAQVKAYWSKIIFTGRGQPPRQATSSAEAKKIIVENPNAIGYIESRLVDGTVRVLASR